MRFRSIAALEKDNRRLHDHLQQWTASWSQLEAQHSRVENGLVREVQGWKQRCNDAQRDVAVAHAALEAASQQLQALAAAQARDQAVRLQASAALAVAQACVADERGRGAALERQLATAREQLALQQEDVAASHGRCLELMARLAAAVREPHAVGDGALAVASVGGGLAQQLPLLPYVAGAYARRWQGWCLCMQRMCVHGVLCVVRLLPSARWLFG